LAPFEIAQVAVPVFDIGELAGQTPDPTLVTTSVGKVGVRVGLGSTGDYLASLVPNIEDGEIFDNGYDNNPIANTVLVDTGQLAQGTHQFWFLISCTVQAKFRFLWRNAADDANIADFSMIAGGGGTPFIAGPFAFNVTVNERFRIDNPDAITGDVGATIIAGKASPSTAG